MTNMNYPVARKYHSMALLCRFFGAIVILGGLLWHTAAHAYEPSEWVSFDGNMRVEVANGHELTHSSFTVASWVWFDDNTGRQVILNRGGAAKLFTFYLFDGQLRMLVQYGSSAYDKAIHTPAPAVGVWTHVAGTYDGSSIKLYVNGVLADTVTAVGSIPASNEPVIIGAQNATERFLKGRLQDVAYWKSVVSGADILALAQGTKTPSQVNASDLLALWQEEVQSQPRKFQEVAGLWRNTVGSNSKYWGYVFAQPATYGTIDTGYRGIWSYAGDPGDPGGYKYSGGLGTYPAKHKPFAHYNAAQQKTFFVWGGATETSNRALVHMISYYDHSTGMVPKPTRIWNKGTGDAHDNPVMTIDDAGTIWVFSTSHGVSLPSFVHRSTQPYNIREFEPVDATYLDDDGVTRLPLNNFSYFQVWYRSGSGFIAFFTKYEQIHMVGQRRTLYFMTSADGVSWSKIQQIGAIQRGHYQVSAMDEGSNTVGTAFNYHPQSGGLDARANVYYVETSDMGQTWQTAGGQTVTLPLTTVNNAARAVDTKKDNRLAYMKDLRYDQNGRPVIVYLSSSGWEAIPENGPRTWHTARWNGGPDWVVSDAFNSDHNYDMGSLYIRNDGSWETVAPTTSRVSSHKTGGEMVLWRSTDNGSTWTEQQQLTAGSQRDHTYARRPVNVNDGFYAFWADGDTSVAPNETCAMQSNLYFHDRQANWVHRLPRVMTQNMVTPLVATTTIPDTDFFSDDFGDGAANNWIEVDGAWSVQNGEYVQSAETGFGVATRGDTSWEDYVLEADVKRTGGTRNVGLIVRYQDPCNYYHVTYENDSKQWQLHRRIDGLNQSVGDPSDPVSWPANTFHNLKFTVDGNQFILKQQGATVLDRTDTALTPGSLLWTGRAGVRTFLNSGAFDNVSVMPVNPSPLFFDDFQDGNALGWTEVAGTWFMADVGGSWLYMQTDMASFGISVNGNAAWSDYILSADVSHVGPGTRSVGLIVRYQDASNYYFAIYERNLGLWRFYRRVNGGNTLLASTSKSWPASTYHRIRVNVKGNRFIVIDNDTTVIDITDGSLATGKIGLRTYQNIGIFDNVLVLPN